MARKLGISKSEMLRMREEGLSNRDIAKLLDIHHATVYNWIGPQGGRMENLAAFDEPKAREVGTPKEEIKTAPRAVDTLTVMFEILHSANGTFRAEVDYEQELVSLGQNTYPFDDLAELATFIIGLASRVEQKN